MAERFLKEIKIAASSGHRVHAMANALWCMGMTVPACVDRQRRRLGRAEREPQHLRVLGGYVGVRLRLTLNTHVAASRAGGTLEAP